MVLYYSLEVADVFISIAEISIGTSFSGPVAHVLDNAKVFLVVLYCSLEVAERVIGIAEIGIVISFSGPVANILGDAKVFLVVLYYSLEVADVFRSIAEIAIGQSFSALSPTSLAMLRCFSWYSIARWKSPRER